MNEMIAQLIREEIKKENQKSYYFMAGLPRAGSTLLSSILNQNPRFYSGPSSPVTGMMLTLEQYVPTDELYLAYPKPAQIGEIISNIIKHYYSDIKQPVIFDKNRSWVNRIHYIPGYFGIEPKIICPVRNIDEILASFIAMHDRNPFHVNGRVNFIDEMLIKTNTPMTDENRCKLLMSNDGIVGQSYFGIRKALVEGNQKSIHFVEYANLIDDPEATMRSLYDFIGEEYFQHDFSNIKNTNQENDAAVYGLADMHEVRPTVARSGIDAKQVLPEIVYESCKGLEFWRDLQTFDSSTAQPAEDTNAVGNDGAEASANIIGA